MPNGLSPGIGRRDRRVSALGQKQTDRDLEALTVFLKWRVALLTGNPKAGSYRCELTGRTFAAGNYQNSQ